MAIEEMVGTAQDAFAHPTIRPIQFSNSLSAFVIARSVCDEAIQSSIVVLDWIASLRSQ
jgi:hypothetical protein